MPLVNAKCTNCGANLTVDNAKDAAICEYCGSAYMVEKAINNYSITNNIQANVINIYSGNSADFVIRAGVLEKYNGSAVDVVIPDNVSVIGDAAFAECKGLRSIQIPDGITEISDAAFRSCTSLSEIFIPDSVTTIGRGAFWKCSSLTKIHISSNVTKIESKTFEACISLTEISIPDSVNVLSGFENCTSLIKVTLPNTSIKVECNAFEGCENLRIINIPPNAEVSHTCFDNKSPIYKDLLIEYYKRRNACIYCGSTDGFKGLFVAKCVRCGKPKGY